MATPNRVFVTGGTGFIGKHLIKRLVGEGISVVALARNAAHLPSGVEKVLQGDLLSLDVPSTVEFLRDNSVDVVVHLAAAMHFYPKDMDYVWKINVAGTKKLAQACIESGARMIYISSTEAMGGSLQISRPYDEETKCDPFFHYGKSKLAAEQALKEMEPNLKYTILRMTGVMGPDDDFAMYELIQAVSYGLFFFSPKNDGKIMFTHVDDVVSGIMCALPAKNIALGKTYIICPDNYMTYSTCIKYLCRELHRIQPIIQFPVSLIRVVTVVLDPLMNMGKNKIFLFKTDTVGRMAEDRWFSNEKAKKEIGYVPQYSFQEGLSHTIQHMKHKGQLNAWPISPVGIICLALLASFVLKMIL